MKASGVCILIVVVIGLTGLAPAGSEAADAANSVNIGFGGMPRLMAHCDANVLFIEYERRLAGSNVAVLGRAGGVNYRFDDGAYRETGDPKGVDVGVRYYFDGGMEGVFISGTVGYWTGDWIFTENKDTFMPSHGTASSDSLRLNLDAGARFPVGDSPLAVIPVLNLGLFDPSTECVYTAPASLAGTACTRETEVREYFFLAIMAGIAF